MGMTSKYENPRKFDHAVLPVESLEIARKRLSALGFTVAADARHPFGTENCCVFFGDENYLEPLAVGQREDCERTAVKGNVFTAADQAFRFRVGENGFSGLAFVSDDADADHRVFTKNGISAGRKLSFGRTFTDAKGKKEKASFKLAFAKDDRAPDITLFTCQRINVPKADKSALTAHENGVSGIKEVVLSEQVPSDFQYYLQDVLDNRDTPSGSFGMEIAAANVNINVLTPEGMEMEFGVARQSQERGLRCEGIVFSVANAQELKSALDKNGVAYRHTHRYLIVDAAPGQGAFCAFDISGV